MCAGGHAVAFAHGDVAAVGHKAASDFAPWLGLRRMSGGFCWAVRSQQRQSESLWGWRSQQGSYRLQRGSKPPQLRSFCFLVLNLSVFVSVWVFFFFFFATLSIFFFFFFFLQLISTQEVSDVQEEGSRETSPGVRWEEQIRGKVKLCFLHVKSYRSRLTWVICLFVFF